MRGLRAATAAVLFDPRKVSSVVRHRFSRPVRPGAPEDRGSATEGPWRLLTAPEDGQGRCLETRFYADGQHPVSRREGFVRTCCMCERVCKAPAASMGIKCRLYRDEKQRHRSPESTLKKCRPWGVTAAAGQCDPGPSKIGVAGQKILLDPSPIAKVGVEGISILAPTLIGDPLPLVQRVWMASAAFMGSKRTPGKRRQAAQRPLPPTSPRKSRRWDGESADPSSTLKFGTKDSAMLDPLTSAEVSSFFPETTWDACVEPMETKGRP